MYWLASGCDEWTKLLDWTGLRLQTHCVRILFLALKYHQQIQALVGFVLTVSNSRDWVPVFAGMFLVRSDHSTPQLRGSSLSAVHQLLRALLPLPVPPPRETGSPSQLHSYSFINPHSCQSVLREGCFTWAYHRNSESSSSHPIRSKMLPILHIKVKYGLIHTLVIHAN